MQRGGAEVLAGPPGGAVQSEAENGGLMLRRGQILYPLSRYVMRAYYVSSTILG